MKQVFVIGLLCLALFGCSATKEQMTNFGMVMDNLTEARDKLGGILIITAKSKDAAVYQQVRFGAELPADITAILLVGVKGADGE